MGRRRGNRASLHVTFLVGVLVRGTDVPGDCVSTHPRGEGLGRRDLAFIGAFVGLFEGTKVDRDVEDGFNVKVGVTVGRGESGISS